MTKYKCDECKEKHDRIHISIMCSDCVEKQIRGLIKWDKQSNLKEAI